MASFIRVKEIKERNENFMEIEKVCESISELKSGVSWVIIGYTRKCELDSLTVLKEGQQWNILLQILPADQICYVYARVEFGKLPSSCFIIIWTGEQVSEEKRKNADRNEFSVIKLFPKYEYIIYSHSQSNLNKQIADIFTPVRTRHASIRLGRKSEKHTKRHGSVYHKKTSYQTKFFLNPTGDAEGSKPGNEVVQEHCKPRGKCNTVEIGYKNTLWNRNLIIGINHRYENCFPGDGS